MKPIQVELPYPTVEGIEPDIVYARIISPSYAGLMSEMTAILQYTYHAYYFDKEGMSEYADVLRGISLSEMEHMEILGKLLLTLGVKPEYRQELPGCNYYNTSCVSTSTYPQKMLTDDISGEMQAIAEYEKIITQIDNEKVTAIIARIILDEQLHLKLLKDLYNKLLSAEQ